MAGVRVNVPLLAASEGSPALDANNWSVFWLGRVVDSSYTDGRLVGADDGLRVRMQFIDHQATPGDTALVDINGARFPIAFGQTTPFETAHRCGADACRGWSATALLPWAEVGGRPQHGDVWPLRVERGGYVWDGDLHWGLPDFQVEAPGATVITVPVVADAMVGGGTDCGLPDWPEYFSTWGTRNWGTSPYLMTQNQWDVADWPCWAKFLVAWDQTALPPGAQVLSATLVLRHFGDPGYGSGYDPDGSGETVHQVYGLNAAFDETSVGWDTMPLALENISRGVVRPVPDTCIVNNVRYCDPPLVEMLDVSAIAQQAGSDRAYAAIYTAAGQYHAGKHFWSRESHWPPEVQISYVIDDGVATPIPTVPPTPTPTLLATNTATPNASPTAAISPQPSSTPTPPQPTATAQPPERTPTPSPVPPVAPGRTYYMSPTGSDGATGSQAAPWATFERVWRSLSPGDTLVLLDGTYRQSMIPSINGTAGAPVTVRALNDGKAIIDGEFKRTPVEFGHTRPGRGDNFVVEGIVARNSSGDVWYIRSNNVKLRRVSGYNADADDNSSVFTFWTQGGGLLEDCIAAGTGRKAILLYQTQNVTVRRCFARYERWDGRDFCGVTWPNSETVEVYNGDNNILENLIVTGPSPVWLIALQANDDAAALRNNQVLGSITYGAGMAANGTAYNYGARPQPSACGENLRDFTWPNQRAGIALWGQGTIQNNVFRDNFSAGNAALGFTNDKPYGPGAVGTIFDHATISGNGAYAPSGDGETGAQVKLRGIVPTNSQIQGTQYQGEGARLANRYVDGVLTSTPLWPWPMESRAQDELGISITEWARPYVSAGNQPLSVEGAP